MGIVVLERPSARTGLRGLDRPVPLHVQNLFGQQPIQPLLGRRDSVGLASGFKQGMTGQRGVPHRRHAWLAIGLVLADHQKLGEPPPLIARGG